MDAWTARIVKTQGTCGGRARFDGTRIPVWTVHVYWQQGAGDADILAEFPTVSRGNLAAARAYVQVHGAEVAAELGEQGAGDRHG